MCPVSAAASAAGHRGNEDCFVKARDVNGDVVEWDEHGMECAVCLDVATRSRQMFTSGASRRPTSGRRSKRNSGRLSTTQHADAGGAAQSLTRI